MRIALPLLLAATLLGSGCGRQTQREPALGVSREPVAGSLDAPIREPHREPVTTHEAWQFAEYSGVLISTPNYRIYTTIESDRMRDRLASFYEQALEHYTSTLGRLPMPDVPLDTYLFQTRTQWQTKTAEILPDQARMFSNLGRGGFTTRGTAVLYYIDRRGSMRDTLAIAAHEGWHQYTQQTFKHQLPIWLEEGIATYMEGYRADSEGNVEFNPWANYERRQALRSAVRNNRLVPLHDILTRTPQSFLNNSKDSLLTYYSQVWALTHFLAEGENGRYRAALESVLIDAAEGRLVGRMMSSTVTASMRRVGRGAVNRVGPAVVQEYFNRDLDEFERQYNAYVQELAQDRRR